MGVKVKAPFSKLTGNAYLWAMAVDALDFVPTVINGILTLVFGAGIALDLLFDAFQTALCLAIFEDPTIAILNYDFILPPGLDIVPSHTANVYIRSRK